VSLLGALPPGQRSRVVEKIVADAESLVAKGLAADARSLGRARDRRNLDAAEPCDVVAKTCGKPQQAVASTSKKTPVARKSPLEKAASQTFRYSSSGDFAYRIASLVALNAAKVRSAIVSKALCSPGSSRHSAPSYADPTPKWRLLQARNPDSK
jgi:hypothetical protein